MSFEIKLCIECAHYRERKTQELRVATKWRLWSIDNVKLNLSFLPMYSLQEAEKSRENILLS